MGKLQEALIESLKDAVRKRRKAKAEYATALIKRTETYPRNRTMGKRSLLREQNASPTARKAVKTSQNALCELHKFIGEFFPVWAAPVKDLKITGKGEIVVIEFDSGCLSYKITVHEGFCEFHGKRIKTTEPNWGKKLVATISDEVNRDDSRYLKWKV